jgi:hypothetical protein
MSAYLTWRLIIDFLKPQPLIGGLNIIQWASIAGLALLIADRKPSPQNVKRDTKSEYV